jgi:nitrous oxidase accessory protein NosD
MKKLSGLMFAVAAATLAHEAGAADLNVCASGCAFPTIQSAINSSHADDVIHIAAGTYFENLLVPNQRLTFVGAGEDLTVIDGRQHGSVVTLGAFGDSTKPQTIGIVGVTITHGSAQFGGGIRVNNAALDLENSIVSSNSATQSGGGIDVGVSTVPAKRAERAAGSSPKELPSRPFRARRSRITPRSRTAAAFSWTTASPRPP